MDFGVRACSEPALPPINRDKFTFVAAGGRDSTGISLFRTTKTRWWPG